MSVFLYFVGFIPVLALAFGIRGYLRASRQGDSRSAKVAVWGIVLGGLYTLLFGFRVLFRVLGLPMF